MNLKYLSFVALTSILLRTPAYAQLELHNGNDDSLKGIQQLFKEATEEIPDELYDYSIDVEPRDSELKTIGKSDESVYFVLLFSQPPLIEECKPSSYEPCDYNVSVKLTPHSGPDPLKQFRARTRIGSPCKLSTLHWSGTRRFRYFPNANAFSYIAFFSKDKQRIADASSFVPITDVVPTGTSKSELDCSAPSMVILNTSKPKKRNKRK